MDVRQVLVEVGRELDRATREAVLALGHDAVDDLIDVLQDEELLAADSPGDGFAPVHAARLLGELGDPRAVQPLLDVILEGDWDELVVDAASTALPKHGRAALEPLLAAHDAEDDAFERAIFGGYLAELGVADERIYERLVKHLEEQLTLGAGSLAVYGDPRALPLLCQALDEWDPDDPDADAADVTELTYAIEQLGGELTGPQAAKQAAAQRVRQFEASQLSRSGRFLVRRATLPALRSTFESGDGPPLWEVRGILAALVSQPSFAPPSTWLPSVLVDRGTPEGIEAVIDLYNATLGAIARDPADLCPVASDIEATTAFCRGYVDAALADPEWLPARRTLEPMSVMMLLAGTVALDGIEGAVLVQREHATQQARDVLPQLLAEIHRALAPVRAEIAGRGVQRRKAASVGRNDPCLCGSGKKYKRCCGA
jgi:uncharacterized protein YecA (UPF0149 family)